MKRTARSSASSAARTAASAPAPRAPNRPRKRADFTAPVAQRPQRQDLADQARARLEEMIVSLELPPGSVWSEAQLSARLNIGRTPVREALQRLENEHLVTIVTRHGAQVTEINVMQQLLLLELRRALEQLIAVGAARRATALERTRLLDMAAGLEKTAAIDRDVLKFLRHHYEIKNFMATCARNPFVARAIAPCYAMSRRFYYLHYREDPDLAVAARYHAEVVRSVAVGDEAMASAASDKLMDYIVEFTRATITRF